MRRDYFKLTVDGIESPQEKPTVTIEYEGPSGAIEDRLHDGADWLDEDEIDVAYRLLGDLDDPDTDGVVALTNRLTGEYILELNVSADSVFEFVRATEEYHDATGNETRFGIVIESQDERLVEYDISTLLVYDESGNLRKQHSLIPSGVEL